VLDLLFNEIQQDDVRKQALVDLRRRLRNEATKIFNNFKADQILNSLRRRFLGPGGPRAATGEEGD
jgi:hypothetical protein